MFARKIPSLLDVMISDATKNASADPLYECRMGWCTQCACIKADIENKFGPVEYRTEPRMLPTKDKILPCISIQSKEALTFDMINDMGIFKPTISLVRTSEVLARMPSSAEIGNALKTYISSGGKVIVGSRSVVTGDVVIVRNPISLDGARYTDMLVMKSKFLDSYARLPSSEFEVFQNAVPVAATELTAEDLIGWPQDDGRYYYRKGADIFEVSPGSIITANGNAVTEEMAARLEIKRQQDDSLDSILDGDVSVKLGY